MIFFNNKKLEDHELKTLEQSAIDAFKLGIKRINNGEDPRQVGEIEFAIEKLKEYQECADLSNKAIFELLEKNKISLLNIETSSAIKKSFVKAFASTIEICEWYKEIMNLDIGDDLLKEIQQEFISNLKWGHYNYKQMIRLGEFQEDFLKTKEVQEGAEKELLSMIEKNELEEIDDFIEALFLEDSLSKKEIQKSAEEKFISLVKENNFKDALKIKERFNLKDPQKLLKELNDFLNKL